MNKDCLLLAKGIVSEDVYRNLEDAIATNDNYKWDKTMLEAHADVRFLKRQAIIDAKIIEDSVNYIQGQVNVRNAWVEAGKPVSGMNKGSTPAQALSDIISGSGARQGAGRVPLDKYIDGIRGQYIANLVEFIDESRPIHLGLSRKADNEYARNMVRAIFGSDSAKVSKGLQGVKDAWLKTTKALMERFNKAGGSITELTDFNIPVTHYAPNISKAGEEAWVADAKKFFNLRKNAKHTDNLDEDAILRLIYKTVSTEGATEFDPLKVGIQNRTKLGNAHQKFRYLQPKNGDAWLAYTQKYGRHQQPIDAMIEYIDNMSTSIGLLENLGSNPSRNFDNLVAHIQEVTKDLKVGRMAKASLDQIVAKNPGYESLTGDALRNLRNFQTISKLGFAPLTALTDVPFSAITAAYNGISSMKVFTRHMKLLLPGSSADRKLAGRMGLLMDYAVSRASAVNRFSDVGGYGITHRMADISTRASGLNHWTNSGKTAFGLEYLANMGDVATSGKLPSGGLKHAFERYGITDADWAVMKTAVDKDGFLDVTRLGLEHDQLKARVIGMVREETSFAIPEPNAKARAVTQMGTRRNTPANEWIKTAGQFKSFGVSMVLSHMGRILNDTTNMPTRVIYATSLLVGAGAIGVAVLQLKDIAKGRTPREVDAKLIGEGLLQGGALGVLGDLVFNDPNLFGGLPAYVTGPTMGDFVNLSKFMWEAKDEIAAKGIANAWYKTMVPGTVAGLEQAATAFGTRMWYSRLLIERSILNRVNEAVDPDFYKDQRNLRKWLREERGQQMWVE